MYIGCIVYKGFYSYYFVNDSESVISVAVNNQGTYGDEEGEYSTGVANKDLGQIAPMGIAKIEASDVDGLDYRALFSVAVTVDAVTSRYKFPSLSPYGLSDENAKDLPVLNRKGFRIELTPVHSS